ncbi:MAG: outer rane lipoproteinsorting protein [Proteobacteria bacterium]|nr:outer rane lipoproteinsorting protein [Pseudomonadota bacterium]
MNRKFLSSVATLALCCAAGSALAAVSAQEAARLGKDLTPMGAEKAGNAAGTIPAWDGGITSPAKAGFPDFKTGGHHPDPYAADKVLYKVDASNMGKYTALLTEGHKAMLNAYKGSYFLNVYPTRRSTAFPQRIYDATMTNATSAKLAPGGNGVTGAIGGVPFPIPKEGVEVFWNHILRYRADVAARNIGQAAVTRSGDYTMVKFHDEAYFAYHLPGAKEAELDNVIVYFLQETTAPARLAGEILLVHETLDQAKENRRAWLYNPGQRRVRRAPNAPPRTACAPPTSSTS